MQFEPYKNYPNGLSRNDGTIAFYSMIKSLVTEDSIVLDYGAGRAAWYFDDKNTLRRDTRNLHGKVKHLIAADIDSAIFENQACDEQQLIVDGKLNVENNSVDLIIADYVLEHISDCEAFVMQINEILRKGGWFCARTPHKYNYISIMASIIKNTNHAKVLQYAQPGRNEIDVFPTVYKLNTMKSISSYFVGWENHSYIFRSDPDYYFNNKIIFKLQDILHKVIFKELCGNLFIFIKKC